MLSYAMLCCDVLCFLCCAVMCYAFYVVQWSAMLSMLSCEVLCSYIMLGGAMFSMLCYVFYVVLWCAMFWYYALRCYVLILCWEVQCFLCCAMLSMLCCDVLCSLCCVAMCFVVPWPTPQGDHIGPDHKWGLRDSGLVRTLLGGKWYHLSKENRTI